ncbi:MAG: DNA repair protein RecO [Lachnospiraceae bacterium]|nr:DNA repair protein RecO [Lachnospiraceae bacterium]
MTGEIKLTGIVLGSVPMGDYDRRVSLLTVEKGRISAFAKGARRPMSALRAASRLFTYANFTVYAWRDSYSVTNCENAIYFDEITMDPEKTYYGMYFCELLEYFTRENSDEKEQVKLLFTALKALIKGHIPLPLIRRIFELRALANYGEAPNVFECSVCRKKEDVKEWVFDVNRGVISCADCYRAGGHADNAYGTSQNSDIIRISETVRYTMHYIITSQYKALFSFNLTPEVLKLLERAVGQYLKIHVDKPLKTLELVETLGYNV